MSGAYSVIQFATVGYRHRLSTNWVLVGDLKAYRIPTVLSPTTVDAVGVSHTVERTVTGHAFQGLVAIEWALDGE